MKKILLFVYLTGLSLLSFGQSNVPDSPEYKESKKEGKLQEEKSKSEYEGNFLRLHNDPEVLGSDTSGSSDSFQLSGTIEQPICAIPDPSGDSSYHALPPNDDMSSEEIILPFNFNFYGDTFNKVYVNNNGNISFLKPYSEFSSSGFPDNYNMIAPFWADIDTEGEGSGLVYYKVEPTRFTVIWYKVGYYHRQSDKRNTFKLIITDGNDPEIGVGNNVAFIYEDMQWTTGSASGGMAGFGGTPATVGINKGTGNNSCYFYQLGRFGKKGSEYISAKDISGVDFLDNKCFYYDISKIRELKTDFSYVNPYCGTTFNSEIENPDNCTITSYLWNFGDGSTSTEAHPVHSYTSSGTYNVKLTIAYRCATCDPKTLSVEKKVPVSISEITFVESVIDVTVEEKEDVLSFAASTFNDSWTLNYFNEGQLSGNSYLNGSEGVWRNEGSYVYNVPRKSSESVNLSSDGTFKLDFFNWEQAHLNAIPNFIKTTTVSQYSPYSFELENMNALGIYSAAVYDYGDQLPAAVGNNMKYREMGFTSFEYMDGVHSGNFLFGNNSFSNHATFKIISGNKNLAVAEGKPEEFQKLNKIDVVAFSSEFSFGLKFMKYISDNEIVCVQKHPTDPMKAILILRRAPFQHVWAGGGKVKKQISHIATPVIDRSFSHSGRASLKVDSDQTFRQPLIKLDSGKMYYLSVWASRKSFNVNKPLIDDRIGVDIILRDNKEKVVSEVHLKPSGRVIEGWQQIKGQFVCPDKELKLDLRFRNAVTGACWFDDLRLHPFHGNMQSYVYDTDNYRLSATLDEENFATLYYYDEEGNLYLVKKETEDGIKTLSENITYIVENRE